jgi:translocation and assembly module TamB
MRRALLIIIITVMLICASGLYFVLSTEKGLQWVFARAEAIMPGKLSINNIRGRLTGPITLTGLSYNSDEFIASIDSFSLDWKPSRLLFLQMHLVDLTSSGIRVELRAGDTPPAQSKGLPEVSLPMGIRIDNLLISDIAILQPGNATPFSVKEVSLKAGMDKTGVSIDRFSILTEEFDLDLLGKIRPEGDYPLNIQTEWKIRPEGYTMIAGKGEMSGNMKLIKIRQGVKAPFIADLHIEAYDVIKELRWKADLSVNDLVLQKINSTWPETGVFAKLRSNGTVSSFDLNGTTELSDKQYGDLSGVYSIARSNDTWLIRSVKLSIPGTTASAELSGSHSQVNGAASFQSSVHWNSLGWPLKDDDPVIISREGSFDITGSPDKYSYSLKADVAGTQIPQFNASLSGTGTQKGVIFTSLFTNLLDGNMKGSGAVNLEPLLNWEASLQARSINPGVHWPEWPGKLDMTIKANGGMKSDELLLSIDNASVQGSLRGYPFRADAAFEMAGNAYTLQRFNLTSGSAHVTASGSYAHALDAEWKISVPELAELLPGSKGAIHGQGNISGDPGVPKLTAQVKGSRISLDPYQAGILAIDINVDASDKDPSLIDIKAEDLLIDTQEIKSFILNGSGKIIDHSISLSARTSRESIQLSLDAGYKDNVWEGRLSGSEMDLADFGLWNLKEPARFSLSSQTAQTDNLCWIKSSASACLQTAWTDKEGLAGNAGLADIPLSLFRTLLPADTALDGVLEGAAEISFINNALSGKASFAIPAGTLSYIPDKGETFSIPLEQVRVEGVLNEKSLDIHAGMSLQEKGFMKGEIILPQFAPLEAWKEDQNVSGRIHGELKALDMVPLFTSGVEHTKGVISADLNVSGTLGSPWITGHIRLNEGHAGIPTLGINLKDVNLDVMADATGKVNVEGGFTSGSGKAVLKGDVYVKDLKNIDANIHVMGENIEAVKTPELHVVLSPDIKLHLQNRNIEINGSVSIPEALIEPPDLSDAVPTSKNVFIISESSQELTEEQWQIKSRINLTLGEKVRFKGFGLSCRITGGIHITEDPGNATKAEGAMQILDGLYKAYGQDLTIDKGQFIFVGLLDDPGLDVRAVRKIKDVRAGVQVTGTLKTPEMRIFSMPVMDQSDALSYIIFGRPMKQLSGSEGGQLYGSAVSAGVSGGGLIAKKIGAAFGLEDVEIEKGETSAESALFIGKYISPRLYVSYGIGLFEPINTLRMRYNLSPQWLLQTEYGIESGGDVLYKIER